MLLYNAQRPTDFESYQERGHVGWTDVGGAQIDTFKYEDLSISRQSNIDKELIKEVHLAFSIAPHLFEQDDDKQAHQEGSAAEILSLAAQTSKPKVDIYTAANYERVVEPNLEMLRSLPDGKFRTRDEIDTDIAEQAKALRDEFDKLHSYADPYAAFFGTLGGSVVASMADPFNIATMPLGVGKVAGAGFIKSLSVLMARSFGIGAATEGAIQPFVYNYKQEIDSPYELRDAMLNIAAGGIGNALITGAGHSIAAGFRKLSGKLEDTPENRKLKEAFDELQRLQTFTDDAGPITVAQLEVRLTALNKAMDDLSQGKKIDYDELNGFINAGDLKGYEASVKSTQAEIDHINKSLKGVEIDEVILKKQLKLEKRAAKALTRLEKKAAKSLPSGSGIRLDANVDVADVRANQKVEWEKGEADAKIKAQEDSKVADRELKESRKQGDMVKAKADKEALEARLTELEVEHKAAVGAFEAYISDNAEFTNSAIKVAATDTPRMRAVKDAVNRIVLSLGGQDIKVRVYEGNPDVDGDMRFSRAGDADVSADSVLQFVPFEQAQKLAQAYTDSKGIDYTPATKHVIANPERAALIADEYERMKHNPSDPEVAAAYDAMINETIDQFRLILDAGLKVQFIRGSDPYVNGPSDVIADVKDNNHIWVYSTRDGFGSNDKFDPVDNPLLRETEFEIDGVKLLANDVFRVVHDYFGHIKTGTTFRATGEENAWQSHASMYTPLARRAMTTETRGQNSWLNYGPYGKINRTANTSNTIFADQKIGLLPRWVSEENRVSASDRKDRYDRARRDNETGFEGAVDSSGRVELIHYSREPISRTDPGKWGEGLSGRVRSEQNRRLSGTIGRTYFGIEQAIEGGYKKELGLGSHKQTTTLDGELIYNPHKNPEGLWDNSDIAASEKAIADAGYSGYFVNHKQLGKVVAVFDELEVRKASDTNRQSKSGDTIEAAINPETGELHINASAIRDTDHLTSILREEVIGHYGLRKSLGKEFQGVINDIKATAETNPELRQMWVELSGVDPQTKQVINPDAPYKGMADDVIADEIISKMARDEISDTTWLKLKSIIIKALRKIGLVKDDITITEMKALVAKSEKALKKQSSKVPTITGIKPKAAVDDLSDDAMEAETIRVVNDETVEGVVFDENGNAVDYRNSLIEDENDIAGIESLKVCML